MNIKALMLSVTMALLTQVVASQDMADVEIKINQITTNIYMLQGEGGNIGVLVGADGTLIVDDQFAPLTDKIKTAITTISDHPVQFLLNTHWHYDHTDGNENFGSAGAIIISQANSRERMAHDQVLQLLERPQPAYSAEGLPKITFDDTMMFHYNGEIVNVFHLGPAHTDGDAIIHFTKANVFHTGDVFVRYGLPFIDQPNGGNIEGMIKVIDAIARLADDNSKIIPGHGGLSTKQDLIAYGDMLKSITSTIRNLMDEGKSLSEIIATKSLAKYDGGFIGADDFVKIVYDSILANQ